VDNHQLRTSKRTDDEFSACPMKTLRHNSANSKLFIFQRLATSSAPPRSSPQRLRFGERRVSRHSPTLCTL